MQQKDFNRMQAEAILSAREMHTRASPQKSSDMNTVPLSTGTCTDFGNSYSTQQTYSQKKFQPPPENFQNINFSAPAAQGRSCPNYSSGNSPFSSIFSSLSGLTGLGRGGGSNDFLLIFMLIILLSSDGGDKMLMFALFYIMI